MIVIPAVDIRNGKVVRLFKGNFDMETIYSGDPVNMAIRWEKEGARMLHIVDLDGAAIGKLKNLEVIKKIVSSVDIPVEIGGGLRTEKAVDEVLSCGVKRAIIGTRAYKDPSFLKKLIKKYGKAIVVSVDAVKNQLASEGWTTHISISPKDMIKKFIDLGAETIIYTDILRDGTMGGPNLKRIEEVANFASCNIVIAGGISSLSDIQDIKDLSKENLKGIIVGKAIYEDAFTIKQANRIMEAQ